MRLLPVVLCMAAFTAANAYPFTTFSMENVDVGPVPCPNSTAHCPAGNTCCHITSDQWGCCPVPNAVCCKDDQHCCPSGYTCDTGSGTCTKAAETIAMFKKQPVLKNVVCPDGQSECPNGNTCCMTTSGQWGCCPLPTAVCCSDGKHCCPSGYTCEVSSGKCTKEAETIAMFKKQPALKNIICPDGQSQCPDGDTCCEVSSGEWGCCPVPNATCCSDHVHCCPSGYTCDVGSGKCTKEAETIAMFKKQPVLKNVICPDGQSECPNGNTCCMTTSGKYGCCPLPTAVCCTDRVHCCPSGYTCEVGSGKCTKEAETIAMFKKQPALKNIICPDGQSQCPDGDTCCEVSSGEWGCCPVPNAVCCSDHQHCCPSGYTCDTGSGMCTKAAETIAMFKKQPVLKNVVCPDGQSECPNGNTCCMTTSGQWGCCPLPTAVCCTDRVHCCPSGYTCEVGSGKCTKEAETIAMFKKQPALKNIICPDGQSQCPDGDTCCEVSSGEWGCCPVPNATCCSDHVHCCPSGYTCDVGSGKCTKEAETIAMFKKQPVLKNVICPDGQSQCADGDTCCKVSSGEWGCCPVLNAVCCSDGKHCCPSGYTCDVGSGKCTKEAETIAMFKKQPVLKNVICPDGQSQCADGDTCCKVSSGEWGCCPVLNAVCCSDNKHCCPSGYTCEIGSGTCMKEAETITMFKKQPALKNAICPDGKSQCPSGNTCCHLTSGQWGCCPIANAVCCTDGEHCCPSGYTCDLSAGTCTKQKDLSMSSFLTKIRRYDDRVL